MPLTSSSKSSTYIHALQNPKRETVQRIQNSAQHLLNQMPDLSHAHIRVLAKLITLGCFIIAVNGVIWFLLWLLFLDSWPMAFVSASFVAYAYFNYRVTLTGSYYVALSLMTVGVTFWLSLVAIVASGPGLGYGGSVHGFFLTMAVCLFIVLKKSSLRIRLGVTGIMLLLFLSFHLPIYDFTPLLKISPSTHLLVSQFTWVSVVLASVLFLVFSRETFGHYGPLEFSDNRLNDVFVATQKSKHQDYVQDHHKTRMLAKAAPNCSMLFVALPNLSEAIKQHSESHINRQLNTLLGEFDNAVYDMELEKIDTVKETYMVTASLLSTFENHSEKIIELAKRFKEIAQAIPEIDIKIGVHTGAVTVGIITQPKSIYSVWGKSVDLAFKVQELGELNEITVSEAAYKQVKNRHRFEYKKTIISDELQSLALYQAL